MAKETVVVVGASPKQDRYSNKAQNLLREYGHTVIPIYPTYKEIDGVATCPTLKDVAAKVDSVTLYVNPQRGEAMIDDILALRPNRVIFNPGTESEKMQAAFAAAKIEAINACTLVMLRTDQFEQK